MIVGSPGLQVLTFPLPNLPHLHGETASTEEAREREHWLPENYSPFKEENKNPVRNILNMLPILPDRITKVRTPAFFKKQPAS